jgi:hypothetical protein
MDVYLVPIGPDGYELYCETRDTPEPDVDQRAGWRQNASRTFRSVLAYLDEERQRRAAMRAARHRGTLFQRARNRVVAWLAERVAEQRLLWHLRTQQAAAAHYPDDMSAADTAGIVVRSLRRDGARHGRWLVVNAIGLALTAPLSVIPGPNIPVYYFVFRVVGHYLSWAGARHGVSSVQWQYTPCPPLTDLRRIETLPRTERAVLAHAVAERLGLEHLDTFAERIALASP